MNEDDKVSAFIEKVKATSTQHQYEKIELPDGTVVETDVRVFYDIADALAASYGIGACKNLTEFLTQVDETDEDVIYGLLAAITRRYQAMYGKPKPEMPSGPSREVKGPQSKRGGGRSSIGAAPSKFKSPITESKKVGYEPNLDYNIQEMARFLKSFGADSGKVNEAVKKAKAGQIDVKDYDFSWINSEVLMNPDFPLVEVIKQMREAKEKSENFKVNHDTLNARK